ncbi:MAG: DUF58 domain-containing protein [Planctomycetota bacterium]|nr:DUF58 domain-containing protein [Planctomycetota bacterium]
MTSDSRTYLDPEVLDRIAGLELKARHIVEGYVSGLHRSPFRGFSVEFAEHREYVPGDDIRFLDWKVFGKTDRLYIKRYEEETNLEANLVIDASASMQYTDREDKLPSKFEYACWAAASLGYLITMLQRDAAGLVLFDEQVRLALPAKGGPGHFRNMVHEIERAEPDQGTGIGRALAEVSNAVRRRGLVILFSDLMDDMREVVKGLRQIRQRHEVLLFHVLAEDELSFPFQRLTRFEGLEEELKQVADPAALREAYLAEVTGFRKRLRRICTQNHIDLIEMSTADSLGVVLAAYLARRAARRKA